MKHIDRTNSQVIFDAHVMQKVEFVDVYQIKSVAEGHDRPSTKDLSVLWHSIRRKDSKPNDVKRKTKLSDLKLGWEKPGWREEAAKERERTNHPAVVKDVSFEFDEKASRIKQVESLVAQGIKSPTAIARILDAHPSYISTLLKKVKCE